MTNWLFSRSHYETFFDCPRKRYLAYHSGAHGYGYERIPMEIPLSTGISVHLGLEKLCKLIQQGVKPDDTDIRLVISIVMNDYNAEMDTRGIHCDTPEFTIKEQAHLIQCLIWGWAIRIMPTIIAEYDIISVEQEESYKFEEDVLLMSRPDIVLRNKSTGLYSLHDFKTASSAAYDTWIASWSDSVQMATQTMAFEQRTGQHIDCYYMHGLVKGGRARFSKRGGSKTEQKRQYSSLCYASFDSGIINDNWTYTGSWYDKFPVWGVSFFQKSDDISVAEYWVKQLPEKIISELFVLAGPYERQDNIIANLPTEMPAVELGILEGLHKVYNDPTQQTLDRTFPRSYNCNKYNAQCPMYGPCRNGASWDGYRERQPHHKLEAEKVNVLTPDLLTVGELALVIKDTQKYLASKEEAIEAIKLALTDVGTEAIDEFTFEDPDVIR